MFHVAILVSVPFRGVRCAGLLVVFGGVVGLLWFSVVLWSVIGWSVEGFEGGVGAYLIWFGCRSGGHVWWIRHVAVYRRMWLVRVGSG